MTQHAELIERLRKGSDAETEAWGESGIILGMSHTMEAAADAIEALEREVEGLRKDAARYRLLRECGVDSYHACGTLEELDRQCDVAIQHEGAKDG